MAATERRPARLLAHARFLGAWGHLLAAGVAEAGTLSALAEDTSDADLRELARAGAAASGKLGPVLDAHGGCLDAWLTALLAGGTRRPEHLVAAGALLEREARGAWSRALVWARLDLLAAAGAPLGDALSALAREARDHEAGILAEGLYGAARRTREGAPLVAALAGMGGLTPLERAALAAATPDAPSPTLRALEGLAALPAPEAPAPAAAAPDGKSPLSNLAQAATAGAAPLRRGIERVLSGIEGALGIGPPPEPAPGPAQLAREAVQARAAARAPAPPPAPVAPPEPEPAGGKKKTIGMDSGPVPVAGFEAGKAVVGEATRLDVPPPDPAEAWARALDAARGKLTLLELQPAERDLAPQVERELARLRASLPAGERGRRLATPLDDLELRLLAWKERHAPR